MENHYHHSHHPSILLDRNQDKKENVAAHRVDDEEELTINANQDLLCLRGLVRVMTDTSSPPSVRLFIMEAILHRVQTGTLYHNNNNNNNNDTDNSFSVVVDTQEEELANSLGVALGDLLFLPGARHVMTRILTETNENDDDNNEATESSLSSLLFRNSSKNRLLLLQESQHNNFLTRCLDTLMDYFGNLEKSVSTATPSAVLQQRQNQRQRIVTPTRENNNKKRVQEKETRILLLLLHKTDRYYRLFRMP